MQLQDEYQVKLDAFCGPLDLLLYLIRRAEVEIHDVPIAEITDQYLHLLQEVENIDIEAAGEFLVMAATLMEIKSRTLLPSPPPEEPDEELIDPRLELIQQLLEYKKFKDAAQSLGSAAEERGQRFGRIAVLPPADGEPEVDLEQVQVWNLLSAFSKVLREIGLSRRKLEVVYDDTPLALHAADIVDFLQREGGSTHFEHIFAGRNKGEVIGLFLALLELVRAKRVRAEQGASFDTIILHLLDALPLKETEVDGTFEERNPPELQTGES